MNLEDQYWTKKKILNETPHFIKELHDPLHQKLLILTMDGTYIPTQTNQENHVLKKLMWSPQKEYTLIKPHLICTLSGKH